MILGSAFAHVDEQIKFVEIKPAIQAGKFYKNKSTKKLIIVFQKAIKEYAPRVLESLINDASECLRDTLNNGDEELGIPPANPLEVDSINIDFDNFDVISEYIR